jgi:hypothetical protein
MCIRRSLTYNEQCPSCKHASLASQLAPVRRLDALTDILHNVRALVDAVVASSANGTRTKPRGKRNATRATDSAVNTVRKRAKVADTDADDDDNDDDGEFVDDGDGDDDSLLASPRRCARNDVLRRLKRRLSNNNNHINNRLSRRSRPRKPSRSPSSASTMARSDFRVRCATRKLNCSL